MTAIDPKRTFFKRVLTPLILFNSKQSLEKDTDHFISSVSFCY